MGAFRMHIYIRDKEGFCKLRNEIRSLWYQLYGESLNMHSVIERSLMLTRDYLRDSKYINVKTRLDFFGRVHK